MWDLRIVVGNPSDSRKSQAKCQVKSPQKGRGARAGRKGESRKPKGSPALSEMTNLATWEVFDWCPRKKGEKQKKVFLDSVGEVMANKKVRKEAREKNYIPLHFNNRRRV